MLHEGGTGVIRQRWAGGRVLLGDEDGGARDDPARGQADLVHRERPGSTTSGATSPNDRTRVHWDWFSCRFDDRTELMLYRFRDGHMNGTAVDRAGHGRLVQTFTAKPGTARLPRRRAQLAARLDARRPVRAPDRQRLRAIVPDQLFRSVILPTFWEGAVTATGTKSGVCFVEESYR